MTSSQRDEDLVYVMEHNIYTTDGGERDTQFLEFV